MGIDGREQSTVADIQWPFATSSASAFAVWPMLLSFCWSMDGLGVLQAPAIEELVLSFPDQINGYDEVDRCRKNGNLLRSSPWLDELNIQMCTKIPDCGRHISFLSNSNLPKF